MPSTEEHVAMLEDRVAKLEADDAKLHGILDGATDFLKRWPWLSTILPALLALGGSWFAAHQGVIGQPAEKAAQAAPVDYKELGKAIASSVVQGISDHQKAAKVEDKE